MALPLVDIGRLAVPAEDNTWLEIEARVTGESKQEIVRRVLHERAARETLLFLKRAELHKAFNNIHGSSADTARNDGGKA